MACYSVTLLHRDFLAVFVKFRKNEIEKKNFQTNSKRYDIFGKD